MVLVAIVSTQVGAAIATQLFSRVSPVGVVAIRNVIAATLLLAIWRPWKRRHGEGAVRAALQLGLALAVMNVGFYQAIDHIPMGIAVTVEFLGPIGVAVIRSEKRSDLIWAGLAVAGVALIAEPWSGGGSIDPVGIAWAALAAFGWAAYILSTERAGRAFRGGEGLSLALAVAAALTLVPGLAGHTAELASADLILLGILMAVLSTALPYSLETEALRRMPASVFGIFMSLQPAVAAAVGLVLLGQSLDATQTFAIGLVILASAGAARGINRHSMETTRRKYQNE